LRNLLSILLAAACALHRASAQDIPEGGTPLVPDNAVFALSLTNSSVASKRTVTVEGQSFDRAVQVETRARPANSWDAQLSLAVNKPVRAGDVILAAFWARRVAASGEFGEAYTEFVFERNSDPYTKSAAYLAVLGPEWKRFFVGFAAVEASDAGRAGVNFRIGYEPQTIEIADFVVVDYGTSRTVESLPRTAVTYAGMEPGAAWRAEAERLIDRNRKADLSVTVRDAEGRPVPGASVSARLRRHAYKFGSAVACARLDEASPDADRYRDVIRTHFNRVVIENDLKWGGWEQTSQRPVTMRGLDWLRGQGIEIRGHNLVWPGWDYLPKDLYERRTDPDYLERRVREHITDEATALAGRLVEWDVVNEPYNNHALQDILGADILADWFGLAHECDPGALLYLNDFNIVAAGGMDRAHQDHFFNTLKGLRDAGAPLHGVGVQCHFDNNVTPPERIWSILDRFATLGLPIQATEFDIDSRDARLKSQYMRDFMTAFFAHPSTVGIIMWGFWEGQHWRPDAALWSRSWRLQPWGRVWVDLVTDEWWTDESGVTDENGRYALRGFRGEYEIGVSAGGTTRVFPVALDSAGASVEVRGGTVWIGVPSAGAAAFSLEPNFPNPFNSQTAIRYTVAEAGTVRLELLDSLGHITRTLVDRSHAAGAYEIRLSAADFAATGSGAYMVRMRAGGFRQVRKLLFIK
jgi:GH35 family endo-1,4-beta-xylanase